MSSINTEYVMFTLCFEIQITDEAQSFKDINNKR